MLRTTEVDTLWLSVYSTESGHPELSESECRTLALRLG